MLKFPYSKILIKALFILLPLVLLHLMVSAQTAERPGYIKNCPSCTGGGSSGGGGGGNNCTGQGSTLYVDGTNGISTNSGRTWATAVTTLQRAIDIADECEAVTTILVAKGTYTASTTSGTLAAREVILPVAVCATLLITLLYWMVKYRMGTKLIMLWLYMDLQKQWK